MYDQKTQFFKFKIELINEVSYVSQKKEALKKFKNYKNSF